MTEGQPIRIKILDDSGPQSIHILSGNKGEEQFEDLNARRVELIDKSILAGLAPEEAAEERRISTWMEEFTAPFYLPAIHRLEEALERIRRKKAQNES